ncbi:NAD-glutamate dehydrogenase domain-containing protein [Methylomonas rhizoryzae]|uniref:NAD-glutamate dehydrogenase domain-containing protein n=1 Tax=Methylomonas rhizoryzae TaxID=2608981 RepID=UPI0012325C21|nr:NAD-glutamate dehydrogenase domain-containing protein [Methylomonas rhizoryzae]
MQARNNAWLDNLDRFAVRALGTKQWSGLKNSYVDQLVVEYQAYISPRFALNDILHVQAAFNTGQQLVSWVRPDKYHPEYRLHFYCLQERYLDEFIPVLENLHLRVVDQIQFGFSVNDQRVTLKSFIVRAAGSGCMPFYRIKSLLLAALQRICAGRLENDPLNRLILLSGLSWQACDVLRAYRNYLLQLDHRSSVTTIQQALLENPRVAKSLFDYFEARFRPEPSWQEPSRREEQALFSLRLGLLENMAAVDSIHHDRILRTFFNLIDASVRSNFHLRKDSDDYFVAIKIDSLGVIDMPAPRPQYEIYVHACDMEGIHLRGGKVSRGGIRWSDRIDDFRTEILDLMQTQISKNALIIPTGAKGGFVVKNGRRYENVAAAGKAAYLRLIRGLLDLTDNFCGEQVLCPAEIVAHDDPDPYLVVAADKGTARFSDMANGVAHEYGFWLGDAFASGGSQGYDHKALGITARGAWECVKRHFRELGKDIQTEPFTVVGIGSMDGDVFGNGMLLSRQIRLLAAFSGQHIFLDPDPVDLEAAYNERKRLFELPGSSWDEYDRKLISAGGGVYLRADKDISLSPQIRKWLGIRFKAIDGESLIQALLKAPVELLWLGGIGTYVKAAAEQHEQVGDRNNDNVRIDACDLRALVVGEGANLGFTPKARVEYGLRGGRINTDAVDNSAGVDTSDHEVNLKILLSGLVGKGLLADYRQLFADLTEAVCESVIADNIAQSLCLSLDQRRCAENPALFMQVAARLEACGLLDRELEAFPTDEEIKTRSDHALTRSELAVLMASAKMYLTKQLEEHGDLLQAACYDQYLADYFPPALAVNFKAWFSEHPLAAQIKATVISNRIINQAGSSFLVQEDSQNGNLLNYALSYLALDQIFDAPHYREEVEAANNQAAADIQYEMLLTLEQALIRCCRWAVSHQQALTPDNDTIVHYRRELERYRQHLRQHAQQPLQSVSQAYCGVGVSRPLAERAALMRHMADFMFMTALANKTDLTFNALEILIADIDEQLGTRDLERQLAQMPRRDQWVRAICNTLQADIQDFVAQLLVNMVKASASSCSQFLAGHVDNAAVDKYKSLYLENKKNSPPNLLAYVLLIRQLGGLVCDKSAAAR